MNSQRHDVTIMSFEACRVLVSIAAEHMNPPIAISGHNPFLLWDEFSDINCKVVECDQTSWDDVGGANGKRLRGLIRKLPYMLRLQMNSRLPADK